MYAMIAINLGFEEGVVIVAQELGVQGFDVFSNINFIPISLGLEGEVGKQIDVDKLVRRSFSKSLSDDGQV